MHRDLTDRLRRRVARDFADNVAAAARLLAATESGNQDRERVQAAAVLAASGDLAELRSQVELSHVDWRDLLMNGGLADTDWAATLDRELGHPD